MIPNVVTAGMDLTHSGRLAKVCREHRRVLERADHGTGLMCPAGPEGWHLVDDDYMSIDRHTGKEVAPTSTESPGETMKPTTEESSRACPGCGRLKRGPQARDGKPCFKCRAGKTAPPAKRQVTLRSPPPPPPSPAAAPAAPAEVTKKRTLETARFADRARVLTLWLIQRPAPKNGGPAFLARWRITAAKGAPGRKGKPQLGVAATAATEELARKTWLRMLQQAETDRWTKVEASPKRGRELQVEMFPAAIGKPKRAA